MFNVGNTVRITQRFMGSPVWLNRMENLVGTTSRIVLEHPRNPGEYQLENGYWWPASSLELAVNRTDSAEVEANMPAFEARTIRNEVNNQKPVETPFDLKHGYTYDREVNYHGIMATAAYTIRYNGKSVARFHSMQYPSCCGISILYDFSADDDMTVNEAFIEALDYFFKKTASNWKPNIQFVAIKQAEREEEYDEDDDEYYDKITGISEDYDYNNFIVALNKVLKPTLLSSFINKNSDNQCDLYQAVNPYRE